MKARLSGLVGCVALAALTLSTACLVPPPPGAVFVRVRPPAASVEIRGDAPGPDFVWVEGFHRWDVTRYIWIPGRWERRPHPKAVWVSGRWRHHDRGWYWVEGHWK
jgi:hypothetical protein